jgi:hypothetical protein
VPNVSKALAAGKVFPCKAGETKPVSFSWMSMLIDVDRVGLQIRVCADVACGSWVRCEKRSEPAKLFLGGLKWSPSGFYESCDHSRSSFFHGSRQGSGEIVYVVWWFVPGSDVEWGSGGEKVIGLV